MRKGLWSPDEDEKLRTCLASRIHGSWSDIARKAGLQRCGKSCRRRWMNHLRPELKRGKFTEEEIKLVIKLHEALGNKWSEIATHLAGRTDNDVKNLWNTQIKRQLKSKSHCHISCNSSLKETTPKFPFIIEPPPINGIVGLGGEESPQHSCMSSSSTYSMPNPSNACLVMDGPTNLVASSMTQLSQNLSQQGTTFFQISEPHEEVGPPRLQQGLEENFCDMFDTTHILDIQQLQHIEEKTPTNFSMYVKYPITNFIADKTNLSVESQQHNNASTCTALVTNGSNMYWERASSDCSIDDTSSVSDRSLVEQSCSILSYYQVSHENMEVAPRGRWISSLPNDDWPLENFCTSMW